MSLLRWQPYIEIHAAHDATMLFSIHIFSRPSDHGVGAVSQRQGTEDVDGGSSSRMPDKRN